MKTLFALGSFKLVSISIFLLSLFVSFETLAQCHSERVQLQVLGSGGPELDDGRNSSGYLLWIDGQSKLIIDAGPGTSVAFGDAGGKFEQVKGILLTHLHVDHSLDLPAYIKGSFFTPRDENLIVAGPEKNSLMPSTSEYVQHLMGSNGAFAYLNSYINASKNSDYIIQTKDIGSAKSLLENTIEVGEQITASAVAVHHGPIAAVAWKVNVAGCDIVFSGDMSNERNVLAEFAKGADLLVANNAVPEQAGKVAKNLHMTPTEIGHIAKTAQVKRLLLSHFMKRTLPSQPLTLKQIRTHFSGPVVFAEDGMKLRLTP